MGIYKYTLYRNSNIGIYLKTNDKFMLVPFSLSESKINKLESLLHVKCIKISIAYTRLLGPLISLNNNAILVPRIITEEELEILKSTGLEIIILNIKETAVGNLFVMNDKGVISSSIIPKEVVRTIKDRLGIEVLSMNVASYYQVGSVIVCTNKGAAIHPKASDEEIENVKDILKVDVEPATVNGGVPFVSSGIVANSNNVIVGDLTTGPELIILSKAFKL